MFAEQSLLWEDETVTEERVLLRRRVHRLSSPPSSAVPALLLALALAFLLRSPLSAQTCNLAPVVTQDQAEAFLAPILIDILANDADPDGEAMTPLLVGGTCATVGTVSLLLDLVQFTPPSMGLASPCTITYTVADESGNTSSLGVVTVTNTTVPLFVDSFESGDTSAWSETCQGACGAASK